MIKDSKIIVPVIFFTGIGISAFAQDNYYCTYHTNVACANTTTTTTTSSTTSSTRVTESATTQSTQVTNNISYTLAVTNSATTSIVTTSSFSTTSSLGRTSMSNTSSIKSSTTNVKSDTSTTDSLDSNIEKSSTDIGDSEGDSISASDDSTSSETSEKSSTEKSEEKSSKEKKDDESTEESAEETEESSEEKEEESEEEESSKKKGSIGIAFAKTDDASVTVLPMSFNATDNLAFNASVTYIEDKINNVEGVGDSLIGMSYGFGEAKDYGNFVVSTSFYLPTGKKDKGLTLDVHQLTGGLTYSKTIDSLKANFTTGFTYTAQVMLPTISFEIGDYETDDFLGSKDNSVRYGDKAMFLFGYDQIVYDMFQLNFKYIVLDVASTELSGIEQNDETRYSDLSLGLSMDILGIASLSVGALLPVDESYGSGVAAANKEDRDNLYFITLNKSF